MNATARISSKNGHTVLPAAVRRYLGVGKGSIIQFQSQRNGEVIVKPLPSLESLRGSVKVPGGYSPEIIEEARIDRAEEIIKKVNK